MSKTIIVSGFPRAGTSIVTQVLATHPEIFLFTDGKEIHVLENELLPKWNGSLMDFTRLKKIQEKIKDNILLMKRPNLQYQTEEFQKVFKDAFFIMMTRNKEEMEYSWKNSGMVTGRMKEDPSYYEESLSLINDFVEKDRSKRCILSLENFKENPDWILRKVSTYFDIEKDYDKELLDKKGKWNHQDTAKRLFLKGKAFTDLTFNTTQTLKGLNHIKYISSI